MKSHYDEDAGLFCEKFLIGWENTHGGEKGYAQKSIKIFLYPMGFEPTAINYINYELPNNYPTHNLTGQTFDVLMLAEGLDISNI
ncbi:hypothetical protein QTP88_025700 [Uroleucon formosanum]